MKKTFYCIGILIYGTLSVYHAGAQLKPVPADTANQLKEVVVQSTAGGSYRMEADKMVFKADAALTAKGGTAEEVFRQIPGILVSPSGKLTLRGATPTILIEGRRTNLSLDQIPADQIETVEIITNPSAKYDASGNGIVNIILKKRKKPGWNGSVSGNWTSIPEKTVIGDLNFSQGKWHVNANYFQHWHRAQWTDAVSRVNADGSSLTQDMGAVQTGVFRKGKLSVDFHPDSRNDLTLSGDWGGGVQRLDEGRDIRYFSGGAFSGRALRNTDGKQAAHFGHAALEHTLRFRKDGEKLVSSFSSEMYHGPEYGTYSLQRSATENLSGIAPSLQQYNGGIRAHTLILQSDFTNPLGKGGAKLETGYKISWHHDHNQNIMQDQSTPGGAWILNTNGSYDFHYSDPTYAAYANLNGKRGWFGYQAGLRFEQYNYSGAMPDSGIDIRFHNSGLYPSLFLKADIGKYSQVHLNYSRRVNRPGFDELTPRTDYSDPQNLQRGNPGLKSEFTHLIELAFSHQKGGNTFLATFYFRNTQHVISTYTTALATDTLLTQYVNGKHRNTFGAELTYRGKVAAWWSMTANFNLYHLDISAANILGSLENKGYTWFGKLGSDFLLPAALTLQLNGVFRGPEILPQGKTRTSGELDLAIKRSFLKSKAFTLIASGVDLLNTNRQWSRTSVADQFTQMDKQKYKTRLLKLTVTYDFGSRK